MLDVVSFLLGDSTVSEFYVPMFWNNLSVPSYTTYEDEIDSVPKCQHVRQMLGNHPRERI
jgi:hypothetical protein